MRIDALKKILKNLSETEKRNSGEGIDNLPFLACYVDEVEFKIPSMVFVATLPCEIIGEEIIPLRNDNNAYSLTHTAPSYNKVVVYIINYND